MDIILASSSPRRRELLKQIGIDFKVMSSDADENINLKKTDSVVRELAKIKAGAVFDSLKETESEVLVIGADTIVACDGCILGKPKDEQDATRMLKMLQGRSHEVYTGVSVIHRQSALEGGEVNNKVFYECTQVEFYPMSDKEIKEYVLSKDPMDKAGAYGIQGIFAKFICKINGDYTNVVGLPVGRLYQEIKEFL